MKAVNNRIVTVLFCVPLALVLTVGCSKTKDKPHFGEAIDPKQAKVTLAQLLASPEVYEGKNVVVEGQFAGACGDGDFYFKDRFDIIEADPPQAEVCLLNKGTPIRLYGLVKVRRSGSSEPIEKGEAAETREASERSKKGEVYVKIVGKGVEVIQ